MKNAILAVLLLAAAVLPARAESSAYVGDDALTRESRALEIKGRGFTTFAVDAKTGKVFQIQAVSLQTEPVTGNASTKGGPRDGRALAGLKPHHGLLAKPGPRAGKGRAIEAPKAQAEFIQTKGVKKW